MTEGPRPPTEEEERQLMELPERFCEAPVFLPGMMTALVSATSACWWKLAEEEVEAAVTEGRLNDPLLTRAKEALLEWRGWR